MLYTTGITTGILPITGQIAEAERKRKTNIYIVGIAIAIGVILFLKGK